MTDFSEAYANKLLQGIMRYSHEHEPWVVCKVPLQLRDSGRLDEVLRFAVTWEADAIIGQFRPGDDVDAFRRSGIIPIAQDYRQRFPGIINIVGDYAAAGRMCADYFMEKGVKSFGFFGLHGFVWSDERRDAFFDQVKSRMPDASVSLLEKYDADEAWWYDLERLTRWLRSLPKPVGILACDDQRAYYVMEACKQGGEGMRIPNDIMVLGVDNDETVCQLTSPPLSSLNQATEEAGYNAARMIDKLLALPLAQRFKEVEDIIVRPTFITARSSTDAFIHGNPYISRMMYFISDNLSNHLSVNDVVEQVPMSRRLVESIFRQEVGISIYQYIIRARVERMKDLIVNGHSPLEAADELGMDYKIIARNFKKLTGMTPGEFARKESREQTIQ